MKKILTILIYIFVIFSVYGKSLLKPSTDTITKPHCGIIIEPYISGNKDLNQKQWSSSPAKNPDFWNKTSITSFKILWKEIEPEDNKWDFTIINNILKFCKDNNKTASLVIYPSWPGNSSYEMPAWLSKNMKTKTYAYNAQQTFELPDWNDQNYLKQIKELYSELAKRYDGNKYLETLDFRAFGWWGENHTYSSGPDFPDKYPIAYYPSEKTWIEMADFISSQFRETSILINIAAYPLGANIFPYLIEKGIGVRFDGVGPDSAVITNSRITGKASLAGCTTYGEWARPINEYINDGSWNIDYICNTIFQGHYSMLLCPYDWSDAEYLYRYRREELEKLINAVGYKLYISQMTDNSFVVKNAGSSSVTFNTCLYIEYTDNSVNKVQIKKGTFDFDSEVTIPAVTKNIKKIWLTDKFDRIIPFENIDTQSGVFINY